MHAEILQKKEFEEYNLEIVLVQVKLHISHADMPRDMASVDCWPDVLTKYKQLAMSTRRANRV